MKKKLGQIILLFIVMFVILILDNTVHAESFPNSIINIYELRDNGSLTNYTGPKRLMANGYGQHGYYLGTDTQFLPYKVGDSTENGTGGISDYKYAVFCTLFGAESPAKNSYSVYFNGTTAPSSCVIDNSWDIGLQAGVGAVIDSVTPSNNRFYGNELIDYYDAEIAINKFLFDKTNNGCHISNGSCGTAAVSISVNEITSYDEDLVALAKAAHDKAMKLNDTKMTVSFPNDKKLK